MPPTLTDIDSCVVNTVWVPTIPHRGSCSCNWSGAHEHFYLPKAFCCSFLFLYKCSLTQVFSVGGTFRQCPVGTWACTLPTEWRVCLWTGSSFLGPCCRPGQTASQTVHCAGCSWNFFARLSFAVGPRLPVPPVLLRFSHCKTPPNYQSWSRIRARPLVLNLSPWFPWWNVCYSSYVGQFEIRRTCSLSMDDRSPAWELSLWTPYCPRCGSILYTRNARAFEDTYIFIMFLLRNLK